MIPSFISQLIANNNVNISEIYTYEYIEIAISKDACKMDNLLYK